MKSLKGLLAVLVIVLVAVVVIGGSLVGFNHNAHDSVTASTEPNNTTQTDRKAENSQNNSNQSLEPTNPGDSTLQSVYGNQSNMVVVQPPSIPPEDYLKKMQEAMSIIKDATGLMANAPYMATSPQPGDSSQQVAPSTGGVAMDKIHQGIYKMAQGTTLMDQAIEGMKQEIARAQQKNISFYQIPFNNGQAQLYPNQQYPNLNQLNPNSNQQNLNGQQSTPNSTSQAGVDANNQHSVHDIGSLFSMQTLTYVVYGFLLLSLIGVCIAIFGFINGLFKPTQTSDQPGDSITG